MTNHWRKTSLDMKPPGRGLVFSGSSIGSHQVWWLMKSGSLEE